ncbi:MAG: EAL domain-containing protein [Leptothrix sp. (in: b-proteobacteria)]
MLYTVQDPEALLTFLYAAPAALAQATPQGQIEMMTPLFSQWLMPLAGPGRFSNLFDLLEPVAPQLRQQVRDFAPDNGLICASQAIELPAGLGDPQPRLWVLNVLKLDPQRLMVMLGDESVRLQERHASRKALTDLRATLEDVLAMAQMCLLRQDLATGLIQPDARLAAWCGLPSADTPLTLPALLQHLHPDDRASYAQDHAQAVAGEAGAFRDVRLQRADGDTLHLVGRHSLMHEVDRQGNGHPSALLTFALDVTEQRRAERERLALGEHLSVATTLLGIGTFEVLAQGRQLSWTAQTYALFGCASQTGRPPRQVLAQVLSADQLAQFDAWVEAAFAGADAQGFECAVHLPGAALPRWLLCQGSLRRDAGGQLRSLIGITRDVSDSHRIEAELRIAAAAFDVQEGMLITDARGRIERVNRACAAMTGCADVELVGRHVRVLKSGRHERGFYRALACAVHRDGSWAGEIWLRRCNGEAFPTWLTCRRVISADGTVLRFVHTLVDLAQRKADEQRIEQLVSFDGLTGLANRSLLKSRLQVMLNQARKSPCRGALMSIDLDDFKELNERLGHDAGDARLLQVARRLSACAAPGDLVARLGADEFVLLMPADAQASIESVAHQASTRAEQLLTALRRPGASGGEAGAGAGGMGACIGVVLLDDAADTVAEVMRRADVALHQAKNTGPGSVRYFDVAVQQALWQNAHLEAELRDAIAQDELVMHLQPVVEVDGALRGAEALVRWQHPQRGLLMPGQFIPIAEASHLIRSVTAWVLEVACRQLAAWQPNPAFEPLSLAVNISARDLHDLHFVGELIEILARTGANPNRLKLELTESMLLDSVEEAIETMRAIRQLGVRFALDDFGTGYASLSYLRRLPLDKLKIDQSFVRNLLTNPADATIARMVIDLGRNLGLTVVAEGVETEAQHQLLVAYGCRVFQGYLFGAPGTVEQLEAKVPATR